MTEYEKNYIRNDLKLSLRYYLEQKDNEGLIDTIKEILEFQRECGGLFKYDD